MGPKPQKCPKWLGAGAKGVLTSWRDGLPRVSCTSATLFRTSANLSCTSATGFWSTCTKTPCAPSPNHFFEVSDPCSRHSGSQKSTPDPDTYEKYRDTPPISIALLLQKYALLLAESSTKNHQFVSRYVSGSAPPQHFPETISWTLFRCSLRG